MRAVEPRLVMLVLAAVSVGGARAGEPGLRWVRSLDDAKRIATTEHKDLFINFTGIEWCGNCIDLDRAILSRKEFAPAANHFVLVDLDFPSDREKLGELKDSYDKWMKEYLIHGFPTVVLADAAGLPYAYFTGYEAEVDVAHFMERLLTSRQSREHRDREIAAAREVTGADRAQKLHAAIQSVADALEGIEQRKDDPVLLFYKNEVDEIRRLDADNALKLCALYDARIAAREEYRRRQAIFSQLDRFTAKEDCRAAVAHIDKLLAEVTDGAIRYQLEQRRYGFLDWDEQYALALESLHRLLNDSHCPDEDRNYLSRNEAICLSRLGRLEEAIAYYDRQITAAADRPSDRFYFMRWKMNTLLGSDRHADAIAACRDVQAAEKPNSREWAQATSNLGWAFRYAGKNREAIASFREAHPYWRQNGGDADGLIIIARLQHDLGLDEEARLTLDEAEKAIPLIADKSTKQRKSDRLRDEIKELRLSVRPNAGK